MVPFPWGKRRPWGLPLQILDTAVILAVVSAITFFAMGKYEAEHGAKRNNGFLWALLSIIASIAVFKGLKGGWLMLLGAQIVIFVAIAVWRVVAERKE